jgi:transcriptional regulator with XRE-family HTH domain
MTIKFNLMRVRKERGFTQEYLAKTLGVSRVMYNRYEQGRTEIPVERAKELCRILGIEMEKLYV